MGMYEAEGENKKVQFTAEEIASERSSRSPLFEVPQRRPVGNPPRETFTVVYCLPDGDAEIRYERATDSANKWGDTFLAMRSFMVIKLIPSLNGSKPGIEFLKVRDSLPELLENAVKGYVETPDEDPDDPKNHEIDCTCIMCIPGG
jgi:hypothetical protein